MRLATLRSQYGTTAIRLDSDVMGAQLDFEDVGELLRAEDWRKSAQLSGEPVVFDPEHLDPVILRPEKIICVGLNYSNHISEMKHEAPEDPTLFIKFADALTGPYANVKVPRYAAGQLDYEGELAVIIGTRAHRVDRKHALKHVAGYSIINDYTMRDFQTRTSQFHAGKSFYRTAGFGPWLTTADEWSPGRGARLTTQVNGQMRQHDNTDDLIFSVAQLIEYCSHLYPLNPGDVIATGTPRGVAAARDPQKFLGDADTVRIEIDGLGFIENTTYIED